MDGRICASRCSNAFAKYELYLHSFVLVVGIVKSPVFIELEPAACRQLVDAAAKRHLGVFALCNRHRLGFFEPAFCVGPRSGGADRRNT